MHMLCHVDRLPLRLERQKKLCLFCCLVFNLPRLLRLAAAKIWLRLFRPGAKLIGIALLEHMGDIVASEPIVRRIRMENPGALIVWFVGAHYREIAESHPDIDMAVALRHLSEWIVLRRFGFLDRIVDLHLPGRICRVCRVPLVKTAGDEYINKENYYELGNLLSVMLRNAGLPVFDEGPRLRIPPDACRSIDAFALPPRYVCIHCVSNEASRNWDAAKWAELVRAVTHTSHLNVVEVGLESALSGFVDPFFTSLCGRLSLMETAEVIRRADVFIGVDSGPAHLANAVSTYGIILLGRYREFPDYMPFSGDYADGSNATILQHNGPLLGMPLEPVLATLLERMENGRDANRYAPPCPDARTE